METLLTCHLVGRQTPLLWSFAPQPCRVLWSFSDQMGEHSSPQLCEELGLLVLKAALLVPTVFPEHNAFSSWSYHHTLWAQDLFLNLRGKACATVSLPLCSPIRSSSISPLSSRRACINMSTLSFIQTQLLDVFVHKHVGSEGCKTSFIHRESWNPNLDS